MHVGALFCNVEEFDKYSRYVALPVIVWDVAIEQAMIPVNYFSDLIVKILTVGDRSIAELHSMTNLDENLIRHILERDLGDIVSKAIDKWHLRKAVSTQEIKKKRTRVTILQSLVTKKLIPHPVHRNALKTIDFELDNHGFPKIAVGSKGKPIEIRPYVIRPRELEADGITSDHINDMWDEYEFNDGEIASSDFDGFKSEYIDRPEHMQQPVRRMTEPNTVDYLLVRVDTNLDSGSFACYDLLEPSQDISMAFLDEELKQCMEEDEGLAPRLGIEKVEVPFDLRDSVKARYTKFSEKVIDEICRFLILKDRLKESASEYERLDDAVLARFQTMYECLLRDNDVYPLPDALTRMVDDVSEAKRNKKSSKTPRDYLIPALRRKNIQLDSETFKRLTSFDVWIDMGKDKPSLKSLIVRHLMVYLKSLSDNDWFGAKLAKKGVLEDTLKFLMATAQIRNGFQHYSDDRKVIENYTEFFETVEKQLDIFNEV